METTSQQKNEKGTSAVFAIFETRPALEGAIDALKTRGFRSTDISVLMPSEQGNQNMAYEKSTKAPEGAATGATGGLALGGILGWLVGVGALAIPGIGPFVAAGPILAAFAGAGIGGAVGGVTGALVGFGIPEYEAKRYETFVREGGFLLSVHVDDMTWLSKAKEILKNSGGNDIASTTEERDSSLNISIEDVYRPTV